MIVWDQGSKFSFQGSYMLYQSYKLFHKLKYWARFKKSSKNALNV